MGMALVGSEKDSLVWYYVYGVEKASPKLLLINVITVLVFIIKIIETKYQLVPFLLHFVRGSYR